MLVLLLLLLVVKFLAVHHDLGESVCLVKCVSLLGLFSLLCFALVLSFEHFVAKNGRFLVNVPKLVQLSSRFPLLNDLFTALLELLLERLNLLTKFAGLSLGFIVLEHLCIDLLEVIRLLIYLSLKALALQ